MKDTDLMPFGLHAGKKMANVPASYLLYMGGEMGKKFHKNMTLNEVNILKYIEENKQVLEKQDKEERQKYDY